MPKHRHYDPEAFISDADPDDRGVLMFGYDTINDVRLATNLEGADGYDYYKAYTDYRGGNAGHGHTHTITQGEHIHQLETLPAYYILSYICKL